MKKRGIPIEYAQWYLRHAGNRRTRLVFDSFYSEFFNVDNSLDQGDPFSGILYLIYNSDLPSIADIKWGECLLLFVDDAAIIVTGKSFTETHSKLRNP